jgi:hypothetical protein
VCGLRIRLIKKLAEVLNDVDLTHRNVGDIFDCPQRDGRLLVLEGWAEVVNGVPLSPVVAAPENGSLENAQLSQSIWQLIDLHREGKKDKLAP